MGGYSRAGRHHYVEPAEVGEHSYADFKALLDKYGFEEDEVQAAWDRKVNDHQRAIDWIFNVYQKGRATKHTRPETVRFDTVEDLNLFITEVLLEVDVDEHGNKRGHYISGFRSAAGHKLNNKYFNPLYIHQGFRITKIQDMVIPSDFGTGVIFQILNGCSEKENFELTEVQFTMTYDAAVRWTCNIDGCSQENKIRNQVWKYDTCRLCKKSRSRPTKSTARQASHREH